MKITLICLSIFRRFIIYIQSDSWTLIITYSTRNQVSLLILIKKYVHNFLLEGVLYSGQNSILVCITAPELGCDEELGPGLDKSEGKSFGDGLAQNMLRLVKRSCIEMPVAYFDCLQNGFLRSFRTRKWKRRCSEPRNWNLLVCSA